MSELIGIREAARRLGVSDTAVHKAIKTGRVTVASRTPGSNRPLLAWPQAQSDFIGNSTTAKRSHVGSRGSPVRAADPPPQIPLATSDRMDEQQLPGAVSEPGGSGAGVAGPTYAQSRAIREAYQARLSKLEFEARSGRLVEVDKVKADAFKVGRTIRDGLLNLPDRIAHELAHENDPTRIHLRLTAEIRRVLEELKPPAVA